MRRRMFLGKLHRCTVTHADLDYEGSVSIDADLMAAADILEHEEVHIWNVTRGTRLSTYAMRAPAGSGTVCINGAAAHHMKPGDKVIIATFGELDEAEARAWKPRVVLVDAANRVAEIRRERPGPAMPERVPTPEA